ncbi:MAG: ABC transporter permease [bacterium]
MSVMAAREKISALLPAVTGLLAAIVFTALLLWSCGYDVALAFGALGRGAFGSSFAMAETLVKSIPLLITGLAIALAFRAGVWNIGAEGQLLVGALAAASVASGLARLPAGVGLILLFVAGALAGSAWGAIAGVMKIRRNVPEVVATILLNFIALETVRYAVNGPLMESAGRFPQTDPLAQVLRLWRLLPPARLHAGILLALALAVFLYLFFTRTVFGWQMQMVAANPVAARFAAMAVGRVRLLSLMLSGAMAGLAGVVELTGVTYRLYQNFSPGYGYTAIAVALMAKLHPLAIMGTAFFFGALENGATAMQRQANVSAVIVYTIQGIVIVAVAVISALELRKTKL